MFSQIYKEAGEVLRKFLEKQGGIKTLAYGQDVTNKKAVYALVVETAKYKEILEEVIAATNLKKDFKTLRISWQMLLVMVYELLFGNEKIIGSGRLKKDLLRYESGLRAHVARLCIRKGVSTYKDLLPEHLRTQSQIPRYARVNTAWARVDDVATFFTSQGYSLGPELTDDRKTFCMDPHIPDLLVFAPGTDLHDHQLVNEGKLILQDKASCFPAVAMWPEAGWHVLDGTAAPGNKTSHVAAILHTEGKSANKVGLVDAFEIHERRVLLLRKMLQKARFGQTGSFVNVVTNFESFLDADPKDARYKDVRGIVLDPTCSGSGMSHRLDHWETESKDKDAAWEAWEAEELAIKLKGLAAFQASMIMHAFTFPKVQRITYSTCSIHKEENEEVVAKVLKANKELVEQGAGCQRFELVAPPRLTHWHRRGVNIPSLPAQETDKLIRADASLDQTHGFFCACFQAVPGVTGSIQDTQNPSKKRKKKKSNPTIIPTVTVSVVPTVPGVKDDKPVLEDGQNPSKKRKKKNKKKKSKKKKKVATE